MRPQPAPSAARIASSCWRPSARTSSRFATLAQAINRTMPTVPISTHSVLPMSPTRTSFSKRKRGAMRASAEHCRAEAGVHRKFRGSHGQHARHIGVGLGQRHARFEPGDSLTAEADQAHVRAIEPQGNQQRHCAIHELERRRQDADHFVRVAIHHDAAADDRAIAAEARPPIAIGKNHRAFAARVVVGSGERRVPTPAAHPERQKAMGDRVGPGPPRARPTPVTLAVSGCHMPTS